MCAWLHVVVRRGTSAVVSGKKLDGFKGVFHFGKIPIDGFNVVRWFISHGCPSKEDRDNGAKSGFEAVDGMTLDQIVNDPTWSWVADDIYARAKEIVERIDNARRSSA
ncbi:MAG: hypothetical protein AMS21_00775 [Gemmatimonas sp. SG8_38_2]|nr:MAG: hypothetical protein AMS21_00775 [Gemmatimonas sp. SG8_38_2]